MALLMKDKQLKHGFTERQVASYNTKPHGLQDEDLRTLASFPKKDSPTTLPTDFSRDSSLALQPASPPSRLWTCTDIITSVNS